MPDNKIKVDPLELAKAKEQVRWAMSKATGPAVELDVRVVRALMRALGEDIEIDYAELMKGA
jgi:hypothetical protein